MYRYRKLIVILLAVLLLSGCKVSMDDVGALNWDLSFKETVTADPNEAAIPQNPYGPVDFAKEGDFVTCLAGESAPCIDVSEWQGDINWQQVADAGVKYAMLRIGWRGSEEGLLFQDEYFETNYAGATAAGVRVGGYFFSQAVTVEEAREEAAFALEILGGRTLDLPLAFDWEQLNQTDRTGKMDARTLTDCMLAFCQAVEQAGYEGMIYFNPDLSSRLVYLSELLDYRFWLAMYSDTMTYPFKVDMWQYTDAGTVEGIPGNVDLNVYLIYP